VLTEGSRRSDLQRRGPATSTGGGDGAAQGRSSWRGRRRAAPVILVLQIDVRRCCEARGEVKRVGDAPAARNSGEEQTHRGGAPVEFQGRRGSRLGMAASAVLLGLLRGYCGGSWWVWCGGAAIPRRRRGTLRRSKASAAAARVCGGRGVDRVSRGWSLGV
jgi:hypothetical protein